MVTFAQAQERAERWINADVPAYLAREVRVREFDLGFVVWSEPRDGGPASDDGETRIVIARDSGEATLWPALPVGEIIRRWEEAHGAAAASVADAVPQPARRIDLEATSFLLSPPQWLQDAADRLGVPEPRGASDGAPGDPAPAPLPPPAPPVTTPGPATVTPSYVPTPTPPMPTPYSGSPTPPPAAWRDANDSGAGDSAPATVHAPPISDSDDAHTPPPVTSSEAGTERLPGTPGTGTPPPLPPPPPAPTTPTPPQTG
ncbi:hypothetical protein PV392_30450, partial [Streptomyces sp. ME03-5709C]|nr:hypothetical protein [Streptomyces sp. ME03-5709C]